MASRIDFKRHNFSLYCTTKPSKFAIILIGLLLLVNINQVSSLKPQEKSKSILKLTGIIFSLGYLIPFLGVWIYQTGFQSYTYISIGEPNQFIKYLEWVVGLIAIRYLVISGKKELDRYKVVSYDPLV